MNRLALPVSPLLFLLSDDLVDLRVLVLDDDL